MLAVGEAESGESDAKQRQGRRRRHCASIPVFSILLKFGDLDGVDHRSSRSNELQHMNIVSSGEVEQAIARDRPHVC